MTLPISPHTSSLDHISLESQNVPETNKNLTSEKINEIKHVFENCSKNFDSLNTFSIALELVSNARKIKSFSRTHEKFSTSSREMLEKYHGGTSSMFIDLLISELKKIGIEAETIGYQNINGTTFKFPTPGTPPTDFDAGWNLAEEHAHQTTQHISQINYTDSVGNKKIMVLKKNFLKGDGLHEFNKEQDFVSFLNNTVSVNQVNRETPNNTVRKLSQIMTTLTFYDPKRNDSMQLSLLSGILSIKNLGLETLDNTPFNLIDLTNNPNELLIIRNDDKIETLSKKKVLSLINKKLKTRFDLPNDFEENLNRLLKHRDDFIKKTMHSSVVIVYKSWEEYKNADLLRQQNEYLNNESSHHYSNGMNEYYLGVKALKKGTEEDAKEHFKLASENFNKGINDKSASQKVPASILLENFIYR